MKKRNSCLFAAITMALCISGTACGKFAEGTVLPWDDPDEGLGGSSIYAVDTTELAGIYVPVDDNSEWYYLDIQDDSTWMLYGENADISGWIGYDEEYEASYAYEDADGSACRFRADEDGTLYFASYGYFYNGEGDDTWYGDDEYGRLTEDDEYGQRLTEDDEYGQRLTEDDEYGQRLTEDDEYGQIGRNTDSYWSWDSDLCQRNVAEFEGVWYYDGDLAAETYIVIDGYGNWSYYQRTSEAEGTEMDCGVFSYSTDETSVYYADSTMYDGVSYRVFEFDTDMLIWGDEGVYYLME